MRLIKRFYLVVLLFALVLTVVACVQEVAILPAQTVYDELVRLVPYEELTVLDAERLAILLDVEEDLLSSSAAGLDASRYTPEALIVVNAATKEGLDALTAALHNYRQLLLDEYRDYRPQEMFKIEDSRVQVHGLQAVFMIVKDARQAGEALAEVQKR